MAGCLRVTASTCWPAGWTARSRAGALARSRPAQPRGRRPSTWPGRTVLEHDTHGKHLLTRLAGGLTLHTHLRMQGSWTVVRPGQAAARGG